MRTSDNFGSSAGDRRKAVCRSRILYHLAARAAALAALFALAAAHPAGAELSAKDAFILIKTVAPGDALTAAASFMGMHDAEWALDASGDIMVRRWGRAADDWTFDALHNNDIVRASRVTWRTSGRAEQQRLIAALTSEGRKTLGERARMPDQTSAEWLEADGNLMIRAEMSPDGLSLTLTTGIRGSEKFGTEQFGF